MPETNKKILLAEDEKALASVLVHKLNLSGFEVKHAEDGVQAIEFLKQEKFDLALLDIMMPDLGGFDVLKKIQELNIDLPAIMLSSLSQTEDVVKAKHYGAVDYLVKTKVTPAEIVKKIQDYFSTK